MLEEQLILLECTLHGERRYDRAWLEQILHPNFQEITRSGLIVNRSQTISSLLGEKNPPPILSSDFRLTQLGEYSAILHYRSSYADGSHQALRTSYWLLTEIQQWVLVFHQGTPAVKDICRQALTR